MKLVKTILRFWYDLLIGEDWKIAVAVVLPLALSGVLLGTGEVSRVVVPLVCGGLLLAAFVGALVLDVWS
jgi:hypothetical protein